MPTWDFDCTSCGSSMTLFIPVEMMKKKKMSANKFCCPECQTTKIKLTGYDALDASTHTQLVLRVREMEERVEAIEAQLKGEVEVDAEFDL